MTDTKRKELAIELAEVNIERTEQRLQLKEKHRRELKAFDKVTRESLSAKRKDIEAQLTKGLFDTED